MSCGLYLGSCAIEVRRCHYFLFIFIHKSIGSLYRLFLVAILIDLTMQWEWDTFWSTQDLFVCGLHVFNAWWVDSPSWVFHLMPLLCQEKNVFSIILHCPNICAWHCGWWHVNLRSILTCSVSRSASCMVLCQGGVGQLSCIHAARCSFRLEDLCSNVTVPRRFGLPSNPLRIFTCRRP